jgi:hypothetical protein
VLQKAGISTRNVAQACVRLHAGISQSAEIAEKFHVFIGAFALALRMLCMPA